MKIEKAQKKIFYFRKVGYLEGTSLLVLLFIAMPLKHIYGHPYPVRIVGAIHGALFILYVGQLAYISSEYNWPTKKALTGFLGAVLPFGTFYFDKILKRDMENESSHS